MRGLWWSFSEFLRRCTFIFRCFFCKEVLRYVAVLVLVYVYLLQLVCMLYILEDGDGGSLI